MNKVYDEKEVLAIDRELRGRTYMNPRSKNRFFVHAVVQDLDTKAVNVIFSNVYTQTMNSVTIQKFQEVINVDGKMTKRFVVETKPSNTVTFIQPKNDVQRRIEKYEKDEQIKNFSPK